MHTANWDHSVDFKDKVVGLIGTGSSSVQVLPNIQPLVKEVQVYIRSPTWINPPISELLGSNPEDSPPVPRFYSEEDRKKFRDDPEYHLQYRQKMEADLNGFFFAFKQGSDENNMFRKIITESMLRRLGPGHEELKKHLFPTFSPGCRRLTPGEGYLEALVELNVKHVYEKIERITKKGLLTADGTEHKMDILVCATGFKVAFRPAFTVINSKGVSIQEEWGEGVNLYFGMSAPRCAPSALALICVLTSNQISQLFHDCRSRCCVG
jgi:cation diffusion facilitator CzcD-associated flavoprotein CzcO